jgi:hypothetical protein
MCCARAIVTIKAKIVGHEQWNSIQRGRRIQEELALGLHTKAGVPLYQYGIEDVKTFQRFLVGYQIHVISSFQEPLRVHVITSLSSSTLRKADVLYSAVHNGPGRTVRWTVALFLFRLVVIHWSVDSSV